MLSWCKIRDSKVGGVGLKCKDILVDNVIVFVWSPVIHISRAKLQVGLQRVFSLGGCQPCVTCHHISLYVLECTVNPEMAIQECTLGNKCILLMGLNWYMQHVVWLQCLHSFCRSSCNCHVLQNFACH